MPGRSRWRRAFGVQGRGGDSSVIAILERQLEETARACKLARAVAEGSSVPGDAREKAAEIEHGGDVLRGELVTRLQDALVSPLSREDLFRLSRSIDDVLDNLRDFVREWDLYQVAGTATFVGIIDAIAAGVDDLSLAVRTIAGGADDMSESALASKKSANEVRRLYDVEVARLFSGELSMEVLKSRELLRRLDVVGLRLNEAADVLADAAVKRQV
ncbi:MAG: DUF47 family protein [Thermoleophilia bacterium]|jgi:uncharacterized protein Yka (UPF0111/DUF47 family)|nr:DUF47 family protein [Thermoleophilia bacterium]